MKHNVITEPELLVNDAHGIYIPQLFVQQYRPCIVDAEAKAEDLNIIAQGPEHDEYWETWDHLLVNGLSVKNDYGQVLTVEYLPESCDLWAVPENYEYPEY